MNYNHQPTTFSIWKGVRYFFYFLLVLLIFTLVSSAVFAYQAKSFINSSWQVKTSLEQAVNSFQLKNFAQASQDASQVEADISQALTELENLKAKKISWLFNRYQELDQIQELLEIGQAVSSSLAKAANLAEDFDKVLVTDLSFKDLPVDKKNQLLTEFVQSLPEINGLKANLDLALNRLEFVRFRGWLSPVSGRFEDLKAQLLSVWTLTDTSLPLLELSPQLIGYPQPSNILVLFQNSDELRPTGGFLGSYSIIRVNKGQAQVLVTSDSYHLDMPVKDTLDTVPPAPLAKYLGVEKWFIRDANWSPDFAESAQTIEDIYSKITSVWPESQPAIYSGKFNAVIAITPQLVADLLKLVGPIEIDGQIYNADNFHHQLQYQVEIAYKDQGISSWDRKDVIGELLGVIETRLMSLQTSEWPGLLQTVNSSLDKKDILMYFDDLYSQSIARNLNWTGEIRQTDKDYFMIVDANLAALKTDAVMQKSFKYSLTQEENKLQAELSLHYEHQGGIDWRTSRYRSLTRVYLPLSADNISAQGFAQDLKVEKDQSLGKTVVSGFLSVDAKTSQDIVIDYTLDESLVDNYSLYIQKQPGTDWQGQLSLDFGDKTKIISFWPKLGAEVFTDFGELNWNTVIDTDKSFGVIID